MLSVVTADAAAADAAYVDAAAATEPSTLVHFCMEVSCPLVL